MNKTEKVKKVDTSFLKKEIVTVQYILKPNGSITDPKHVGYGGLFQGANISIPAPTMDNGKMRNILTDVEKEGLEYILKQDLGIYGDFWKQEYQSGSIFPIFLGKDDVKLDKSDPLDYIKWKVLKISPIVADCIEEIRNRATNRFVLLEEGDKIAKEKDTMGATATAWRLQVKYEKSKSALRYILRGLGQYSSKTTSLDFLVVESAKLITKDPKMFVAVAGDVRLEQKILIEECVEAGVVDLRDKKYYTKDGDPISEGDTPTMQVAADHLASNLGQDLRLALEAKLKNSKQ
jgi:hypothetical protein